MVLDVGDDGCVVGVNSSRVESFVGGVVFGDVPWDVSLELVMPGAAYHSLTVLSSLPVARWPASWGLQLRPKPSFV